MSEALRVVEGVAATGGLEGSTIEMAPTTVTSTTFVDIPWVEGYSWSFDPDASAIVTIAAEVRATSAWFAGRLNLRALVDGRATQPGSVEMVEPTRLVPAPLGVTGISWSWA